MKVPYDVVLPQVNVLGSTMAYREAGNPDAPVALFLHGNPDLVVHMGGISSPWCTGGALHGAGPHRVRPIGKPDIEYRFADHVRYLDAFIAKRRNLSSGIRHSARTGEPRWHFTWQPAAVKFIRGLALLEFLWPMPTWEDFPAIARETFQEVQDPGVGEKMILEGNAFVEGVIPLGTVRKLTDEEMSVYRAPFPTAESRRPTWRSRMNCRSLENRRMCIQLWRKHIVF